MKDDSDAVAAEAEVRAIVEDWVNAVRRRDMAAILRNHSPDLLMFDVPPPFESRGIEAYKTSWDLFFAWSKDPVVFEIKEMRVTAGCDIAFVSAAMRCAGSEAGKKDVELDFRLTIGLQKIDGRWTIVHEHHSVPAAS